MINPDCLQGMDFVDKFIQNYDQMVKMGFTKKQILNMLGTLDYVKDFCDTPEWFTSVPKLPKGYKWSDGTKYHNKASKKNDSETYIFLIIGNDLYIKGFLDELYVFYDKKHISEYGNHKEIRLRDKRICVIKDWKNKKDYKVNGLIGITPFFENAISNFWHDNGGNMSMQEDNEIADELANIMFGGVEIGKVP